MGWDDIRALAAAGMDIGSHTRWHRVLDTLDDDELDDELIGSSRDLQRELGSRIRSFARVSRRRCATVSKTCCLAVANTTI